MVESDARIYKVLDFNSTSDFSSSFLFQIQVANLDSTAAFQFKPFDSDFTAQ
jgi:hypothetical protein